MFQNDVFGFCRNNVFGFNNPVLGNTWPTTPYGVLGQNQWHLGTTPYQMNQVPAFYNQLPVHVLASMTQTPWNWNYQPQAYHQGFLPFFGTNLPYQTTGYFGSGINQHGNFGQSPITSTINPFFGQLSATPWGFNSICR
jgi:hypothetical protein